MVTMQSSPSIKAVVFDLDGLMFNTEEIFNKTGQELLRRRGKQFSNELVSQMMGRRPTEAFTIMIDRLDLTDSIEDLRLESDEIFDRLLAVHLAPMPGLFELLEYIEAREVPKAVATSSPRVYLENLLGRFELLDRFPITLSAEDVTHGKPHPEIYLQTAERIGIAAEEMMVLEDSEVGTRAAAAANAVAVAVPHDHSRSHNFSVATYVATGLNDPHLRELIGR
jgi:HAD superfamily hydrolase (TIGR01509 family)